MFLNISTSMPFFPPSGFDVVLSSCPSFDFCSPKAASLVANVLANGLYGAAPGPGVTAGLCAALLEVCIVSGCGREPEFLLVFRNACSISESAVAVVSDPSSSSEDVLSGGGGETLPAESLRAGSSGDCGGVWILTRFSFLPILNGATRHSQSVQSSVLDCLPCEEGRCPTRRPFNPLLLCLKLHIARHVAPERIAGHFSPNCLSSSSKQWPSGV